MSPFINPLTTLAAASLIPLAEAWLEVIVIALKDPTLSDYEKLNKKEHARSAVYAVAVMVPLFFICLLLQYYFLIPALLINRRMIFDPSLKLFRKRKLRLYEGTGPIDALCTKIFGKEGALWELSLELAVTIAALLFTYKLF